MLHRRLRFRRLKRREISPVRRGLTSEPPDETHLHVVSVDHVWYSTEIAFDRFIYEGERQSQ